jgi:molybdate transport system substrate-binding protein
MLKRKIGMVLLTLAVLVAVIISANAQTMQSGQKTQLTVFAAASLKDAFNAIKANYEAQHPDVTVVYNFDGSQILRSQIDQGATADVFASANQPQMDQLVSEGYVDSANVKDFANNKLALIVPKSNPGKVNSLSDVARPGIKVVVCAKDVPCGSYTLQLLDNIANSQASGKDFKSKVLSNVVSQETNVNDAVSKVALGEADAAFAYVSDVPREMTSKVTVIPIPDSVNVLATYPISVLKQSNNQAAADSFVDYVLSPDGQATLNNYGFVTSNGGIRQPLTAPQQSQTATA